MSHQHRKQYNVLFPNKSLSPPYRHHPWAAVWQSRYRREICLFLSQRHPCRSAESAVLTLPCVGNIFPSFPASHLSVRVGCSEDLSQEYPLPAYPVLRGQFIRDATSDSLCSLKKYKLSQCALKTLSSLYGTELQGICSFLPGNFTPQRFGQKNT